MIEIAISGGRFAYLQDLGLDHSPLGLVRVLPGEHADALRGEPLERLVASPALYVCVADVALLLEDDFFGFVLNLPVPPKEDRRPVAVTLTLGEDWRRWWVRDSDGTESPAPVFAAEHPDVTIEHLPRLGEYMTPEYLKARIEAGWRPWNRLQIEIDSASNGRRDQDRIVQPRTMYLTGFASREAAQGFAAAAATQERKLSIDVPEHDEYGQWTVSIERTGYFNPRLDAKLRALAQEFGGTYDGDLDISR